MRSEHVPAEQSARWLALVAWGWMLATGCSGKTSPQVGGETHWLSACADDRECGGAGLRCVCGTCTRSCEDDATCAGPVDAACIDAHSPALLERCEERSLTDARALCLARCAKDEECGPARACVQETCVPRPDDPPVSIQDYAGVDANVSWDTAVALPAPETAISGADSRLVGTWMSHECESLPIAEMCVRFIITQAEDGVVEGMLVFKPVNGTTARVFEPAVDPDHGYPVGVEPSEYAELNLNPVANGTYRMLDARFDNDVLTFNWTPSDLWRDWCAMQTPYPWHVQGREYYQCVPQDADAQATIDRGKQRLCTSSAFEPFCYSEQRGPAPCACIDDPSGETCRTSVCLCDSSHCQVADRRTRSHYYSWRAELQNDRLLGDPDEGASGASMERAEP